MSKNDELQMAMPDTLNENQDFLTKPHKDSEVDALRAEALKTHTAWMRFEKKMGLGGTSSDLNKAEGLADKSESAFAAYVKAEKASPNSVYVKAEHVIPVISEAVDLNSDTVEDFVKELKQGIKVPWVYVDYSDLGSFNSGRLDSGGSGNMHVIIKLSLDPKNEWTNGILQNSDWQMISIEQKSGKISSDYGRFKFRKTNFKNSADAIKKINTWVAKIQAA